MLVGLNVFGLDKEPYNLEVFREILKFNHIDFIELNINDPDFWERIKEVDIYIYMILSTTDSVDLSKSIVPIIENYEKIKIYPEFATSWLYDDKVKEFYLLSQLGYPIIKSWIFWNSNNAEEWVSESSFPLVFKLKSGAESNGVILVKNKTVALKLIKRMFGKGVQTGKFMFSGAVFYKDLTFRKFIHNIALKLYRFYKGIKVHHYWDKHKNYVLFQEFLPDNDHDTRVMVIGKRAYAFRRFNRKNDFRASGSTSQSHDKDAIDERFLKIAFEISEKLKFQSMAYDFLYDKNMEPAIAEISYTFPMIRKWPGYWDQDLEWHPGEFLPQVFILEDLLKSQDLRHPVIKSLAKSGWNKSN